MDSEFKQVLVTDDPQAFADAERINEEAFPQNERQTIEQLLSLGELFPGNKVVSLYEEKTCIGFYHLVELETFVYMAFFAVSSERRGQGYGSKILQAMLSYYKDKPVIGEVEYPSGDAPNYEQRIKRIKFYERNGMPIMKATVDDGAGEKFYIISSVPDVSLEDYLTFMNKLAKVTGKKESAWRLEYE